MNRFTSISLSEMDEVRLMNRTDRKYWFHRDLLDELLHEISDSYYILELMGERNLPYSTTYYDTSENTMYGEHHRGKLNRYKIRRRNYDASQNSFLEIKFKNNKGRTIKQRMAAQYGELKFSDEECDFVRTNSPYGDHELRISLRNSFRRITLVSKEMNERCTIDSNIRFSSLRNEAGIEELIIIEVKSDGRSRSPIIEALRNRRIKPSGLSKYCMGRCLTDRALKENNFKAKRRAMERGFINQTNNLQI